MSNVEHPAINSWKAALWRTAASDYTASLHYPIPAFIYGIVYDHIDHAELQRHSSLPSPFVKS